MLNKRFDFSEDNIKEAFTGDCLQTAVIEEEPPSNAIQKPQDQQEYSCLLKLKYRVKNVILNYEWNLKKQTLQEVCFAECTFNCLANVIKFDFKFSFSNPLFILYCCL